MTEHALVVVLAAALTLLTAITVAAAAGYLARRDHATYPQAIARAAAAFAATLTLITALIVTWTALAH